MLFVTAVDGYAATLNVLAEARLAGRIDDAMRVLLEKRLRVVGQETQGKEGGQ